MKYIMSLIGMMTPFWLFAQSWNVTLIPDSLKKDARVVVRESETILEIRSPGRAVIRDRSVYTILNENGDNFGGYGGWYNQFRSINSVSGVLYDAAGKELRKVRKKDLEDRSGVSEESLIDDTRYKGYNFYYRNYPYSVSFEDETEMNGMLFFPDWAPVVASGTSTQHSKYVVIAPKDYVVRFKPVNCNFQPVVTSSGDKKIYTWETGNLAAITTEPGAPRWKEIIPYVKFAPSEFEAQGFKGRMDSWEGFGKFIYQLLEGRDVLPEETRKKVHELTDGLSDTRQKINLLYEYMQKNTHYISIQLGIGGWQPFPAKDVATKLYGDCKALSNYMIALLKEAGIKGKYVVIYSGEDAPGLMDDFPCFQGNHVIACVPMEKDTVWLECTSQTQSPGYMGSFTGGRKAILIDEAGGHIVQTPDYTCSDNMQLRVVTASINEEGNLDADVSTVYRGVSQELAHNLMREVSAEVRDKYLNNVLHLPTYKVDKSSYEEQKGVMPVMKEKLHVLSPGYASVSGKRIFISPNLFEKSRYRLPVAAARRYDYIYGEAYTDVDSIVILIPPGYHAEAVPDDVNIDSRYGKYSAGVRVMPDRIIYHRMREKRMARYPPADYTGLVNFYEQLYKADHTDVVLVKN